MKLLISLVIIILFSFSCTNKNQGKNTIVVHNYYWAKEGKTEEVYAHRLYASEVRKELGLAVGRVLKRTKVEGELPNVIWECEYSSEEARNEDVRKLTESGAFDSITKKMGALIRKFNRGIYRVN